MKKRSLIEKIKIAYSKYIVSKVYYDRNRGIINTILISSLARSGSTMLMEAINYNNSFRIIFEPFHPQNVDYFSKYKNPTFLKSNCVNSDLHERLQYIFQGKLKNKWADSHNKKIVTTKRIVKAIRSNLMVGYINQNFPEIPVVLLIRNPYATIYSWIRSEYPTETVRKRILEQKVELEKYLPNGVWKTYEQTTDKFEIFIYNWALSYYIPLVALRKENTHIAFFEDLVNNPENELKVLFKFLNIPYSLKAISQIRKPSRTTRKQDIHKMSDAYLSSWEKNFTEEQFKRGSEILSIFNLEGLYKNDKPDKVFLSNFLKLNNNPYPKNQNHSTPNI